MFRTICWCFAILVTGWAVNGFNLAAGETPGLEVPEASRKAVEEERTMKTLGGRQFWGDVQFFHGWRIQQNVFTKHYRLLDVNDNRHAWGTLEDCQTALAAIRTKNKLSPMKGRGVVLIHGIFRSSKCMSTIADSLRKAGYEVFPFNYPSTQVSIPDAAEYLNKSIQSLEGLEEIDIVAHSMGGLVTRAYFAKHQDPRIKRVVFMGTPHHGAELADLLYRNIFVRAASGPGGRQLVTDRDGLIPSLPVPPCEFAVIAGARGTAAGWNPLIPGDDDGTVTVASTRLVGAADFSTVQVTHTFLLGNRDAIDQTVRFLKEGHLCADRPCQPITEPSEVEPIDATKATDAPKTQSSR
jgi:pimeloyl-ACP methyl ester carboxylesterase